MNFNANLPILPSVQCSYFKNTIDHTNRLVCRLNDAITAYNSQLKAINLRLNADISELFKLHLAPPADLVKCSDQHIINLSERVQQLHANFQNNFEEHKKICDLEASMFNKLIDVLSFQTQPAVWIKRAIQDLRLKQTELRNKRENLSGKILSLVNSHSPKEAREAADDFIKVVVEENECQDRIELMEYYLKRITPDFEFCSKQRTALTARL